MAEEAMDRITHHITEHQTELRSGLSELRAELRSGVTEVRTGLAGVRMELTEVQTGLAGVRTELTEVQTGLADARTELTEVRTTISDVDRHMHVLHEDVIDRIAATREYSGPTRTEFAELKEMIEDRLAPLVKTVAQHTVEIERLEQSRG